MIATTRIADGERHDYGGSTALKAKDIQRLAAQGHIPPSLLEQDLAEITDPATGGTLGRVRNPLVAAERTRQRQELLAATERGVGQDPGASAGPAAIGPVLRRWTMRKRFRSPYAREQAGSDGIRSNIPRRTSPARNSRYKSLQHVEQAFRHLKRLPLEIQPMSPPPGGPGAGGTSAEMASQRNRLPNANRPQNANAKVRRHTLAGFQKP